MKKNVTAQPQIHTDERR